MMGRQKRLSALPVLRSSATHTTASVGRNPSMSSSMNQPTLLEEIDLNLADGMPVYDSNGEKVGDVKMYSTTAGYLVADQGPFTQEDLYLPFRLIRSIDPHDLFLSEPTRLLSIS